MDITAFMTLFDTQSEKKEQFTPLSGKRVTMYVCGITPYDTTHLGHAYVYVTFDALQRYLKYKGFEVEYTQNVTDIDDDVLKRARQEGTDWQELGQMWTDRFLADLKALNVLMPDNFVKATSYIDTIVEIIQNLIQKGVAYQKNGGVYFDVTKFPNYGKLSKFNSSQMELISSERGADPKDPDKKNPLDFILWQKSKDSDFDPKFKSKPAWDSPWGEGRPGWHIECSAMIHATLGDQIDIHGGGRDLIFPHHESEIAQSESYSEKVPFVKNWMHIAMLQYKGEKMSKSLGNLVLVSDLLNKYSANTIRFLLLSYHYRNPWEFRYETLDEIQQVVSQITDLIKNSTQKLDVQDDDPILINLLGGLEDDFNTPLVLVQLQALAFSGNPPIPQIKKTLEILGFKFETLETED